LLTCIKVTLRLKLAKTILSSYRNELLVSQLNTLASSKWNWSYSEVLAVTTNSKFTSCPCTHTVPWWDTVTK
jgi:hypothetical protein